MDAAPTIRDSLAQVTALRQQRTAHPALGAAVASVKSLQARRFRGTYTDLMHSPVTGPAVRFFLQELYSDTDYTDRDAQFARIAGTLQTVFPQAVVGTAQALAVLHAQTEGLDHAMGDAWLAQAAAAGANNRALAANHGAIDDGGSQGGVCPPVRENSAGESGHADQHHAALYVAAWRSVGQRPAREQQLQRVLAMGTDLARLTRMPGLRTMLRMMRAPATAAGMGALQKFLEAGFDTFGQLARQRGGVPQFLSTIEAREHALINQMFDAEPVACETKLALTLGQAR